MVLANADIANTTGQTVNDYEIQLSLPGGSIYVSDVYMSTAHNGQPGAAFTMDTIANNGSGLVTIEFSGATLLPGQWTHVGAEGTSSSPAVVQTLAEWTFNGAPVGPNGLSGKLLDLPSGNANDSNFETARVTFYDAPAIGNVIGHEWIEVNGNGPQDVQLVNSNPIPLYGSVAYLNSPTLIPLDQLNETLGGFGADGNIMTFSAVPEPASLFMACTAVLISLGGYTWHRYRIIRPD